MDSPTQPTPPTEADIACAKFIGDMVENLLAGKPHPFGVTFAGSIAAHVRSEVAKATEPLLSRIADLERDRAVLDWIDRYNRIIRYTDVDGGWVWICGNVGAELLNSPHFRTVREAVLWALAEIQKGQP